MNEPLTFINFVAAFAVGSTIEGEVVSFTSHGAMVDVALPGGGEMHCYIPLTAMGTPPPTKARQVLKKGEVRPFVLAGLDPPRRVAELAIAPAATAGPALAAPEPEAATKAAPASKRARTTKAAQPAKKPAAKKAAAARRPPRRRRAAKKAAAKKAAAEEGGGAAKKAATAAKKAPQEGDSEEGRQGQAGPRQEVTGEESRQGAGP